MRESTLHTDSITATDATSETAGRDRRSQRQQADDPEHGAAASVHARRAAHRAGTGRRNHSQSRARHRVPAHRHRERVRGQDLAASGDADRSRGLSLEPVEQPGLRAVGGEADRRYRNSAEGAMDARDAGRVSAPEQPPGLAGDARAGYRRDDRVFLLLPRARGHSADLRDVLRAAHDDQLHSHRRPGAGASARMAAGGGQVHQRLSRARWTNTKIC